MESKFQMQWNLYVQAEIEEQAQTVFCQFKQSIDKEEITFELFPYWKDNKLHKIEASFSLKAKDSSDAIHEALKLAWQVARRLVITNPQSYVDEKWEFHGSEFSKSDIFIDGVDSVSFVVHNFD